MNKGYIEYKPSGYALCMTGKVRQALQSYEPKGCPFKNYTLYNLLCDLFDMYSWKITSGKVPLVCFIKRLQAEGYDKAIAYGNSMIKIIEEA